MQFIISLLASMAALAVSTPMEVHAPLEVTLTPVGNTKVKATVKNTGSQNYNIMYRGTLLDTQPVKSLKVSSGSTQVAFEGIKFSLSTSNLTEASFKELAAGQSVENEIQMASMYSMSSSETYTISASGIMQYAEAGSTLPSGVLRFTSNTLQMKVDGDEAAKVEKAFPSQRLQDRTAVYKNTCSGFNFAVTNAALGSCVQVARAGSEAAISGDAQKFYEYFKTTAHSARVSVSNRLAAISTECSSTSSGKSVTFCAYDPFGRLGCEDGVLAYAYPAYNYVVYCPIFYQASYPYTVNACHGNDKTTTIIHEETHIPNVYSPATDDYAYGFSASSQLTSQEALLNADTYNLYAQAIFAGC